MEEKDTGGRAGPLRPPTRRHLPALAWGIYTGNPALAAGSWGGGGGSGPRRGRLGPNGGRQAGRELMVAS